MEKQKTLLTDNSYCPECGCQIKTKYMIRVDYTGITDDLQKKHFESTSKKSIVGWIKFICNEMEDFQDITIHNLTKQCHIHEEFYKNKILEVKNDIRI